MAKTYTAALAALNNADYNTTVGGQLERIEDSKVVLAYKANEFKLVDNADVAIDTVAKAINAIPFKNILDLTITQAQTTLDEGYYKGGTIKVGNLEEGAGYDLQAKTWTPTESEKVIQPDEGYYGLSSVTVAKIPSQYKDLTQQNLSANLVLSTGVFIDKTTGLPVSGSIPDGMIVHTFTTDYSSYHSESPLYTDYIDLNVRSTTATATPTEEAQTITGDGAFLESVTVEAIDKPKYLAQWTANGTATSDQILLNQIAYVNGVEITGTMPNNAAFTGTDPDNTKQYVLTTEDDLETVFDIPQGYHPYATQVLIHGENKTVTPTKDNQTIEATSGKALHKVTVTGMPGVYIDAAPVTTLTATPSQVRASSKFVGVAGIVETGTMLDSTRSSVANILNMSASGLTIQTYTAGYTEAGSVVLDATLYNALATI